MFLTEKVEHGLHISPQILGTSVKLTTGTEALLEGFLATSLEVPFVWSDAIFKDGEAGFVGLPVFVGTCWQHDKLALSVFGLNGDKQTTST